MLIRALQEPEPWTASSIVAGIILLALVVGFLFYAIRRYLGD